MVVAVGKQFVEEIARAPEDVLSFNGALDRIMQTKYTLGRDAQINSYHVGVVRAPLTRSIAAHFSDIVEEMEAAFKAYIPCKEHGMLVLFSSDATSESVTEWTELPILETMQNIVSRTSSRLFVGIPLCPSFSSASQSVLMA